MMRSLLARTVTVWLIFASPHVSAQVTSKGDESTVKYLDDKPRQRRFTFYDRMVYKGLTVTLTGLDDVEIGSPPDRYRMRLVEPDAIVHHRRPERTFRTPGRRQQPVPLPKELVGQPGITDMINHYQSVTMRFHLSKPARFYAYIHWELTPDPNPGRRLWQVYRLNPNAPWGLYYRDFPAGENAIELSRNSCCGVGLCPLDGLSPKEKIIPVGLVIDGEPTLRVTSEHERDQQLQMAIRVRNPTSGSVVHEGEATVTAKGRDVTHCPLTFPNMVEGVMYFADVRIEGAGAAWELTVPFGRFPAPRLDASSQEPIIPYGGYMKLEVNLAPEIYNRFLAATFYHFRRMHMNAAVLQNWTVGKLDLAQQYGIKAVIRMPRWSVHAVRQDRSLVEHPAILTYMVGDEPKIGEKLDRHLKAYEELTSLMPTRLKPITATIYDGWGRGDEADPLRIYNEHMSQYNLIRFGRLYCFQKLDYGLLNPISYKPRIGATATFLGLEADTKRPWWLAPQFFGHDKPRPVAYWRVPSGTEMAALMHLALAHRCTGILGWGVHSHGPAHGLCFDGRTMAPSPENANDALAAFGRQLTKAKPVLLNFTSVRVQIHRSRPYAVDAAGRWLKDGRIAIYLVNRDLEAGHEAELLLYLGDKVGQRGAGPDAHFDEIASVIDVFTDTPTAFTKHTLESGRFVYLRAQGPRLAPGAAALLVVQSKGQGGRLSFGPDEIKQKRGA